MSDYQTPAAYPLAWPVRVPRTERTRRKRGSFGTKNAGSMKQPITLSQALDRLEHELRLFGAKEIVVSSNVSLRMDGRARSGQGEPEDVGIACYFLIRDKPYCFPCDRWDRVADNVAAVAQHIDALRGIQRWGVGSVEQAFQGYLALPEPARLADWRRVFPGASTIEEVNRQFLSKTFDCHPDRGGAHEQQVLLNEARRAALQELEGA